MNLAQQAEPRREAPMGVVRVHWFTPLLRCEVTVTLFSYKEDPQVRLLAPRPNEYASVVERYTHHA